jgi:hypothetical protein
LVDLLTGRRQLTHLIIDLSLFVFQFDIISFKLCVKVSNRLLCILEFRDTDMQMILKLFELALLFCLQGYKLFNEVQEIPWSDKIELFSSF